MHVLIEGVTLLTEDQWSFLALVGERIVPPLAHLDQEGRQRFRRIIATALAERPPGVHKQIRLFLSVVRTAPRLRWGRSYPQLSPEEQERFLRWLQDRAPRRLRQGFWGLKTLVFMGYFGQWELYPSLCYAPTFSGNEKLDA